MPLVEVAVADVADIEDVVVVGNPAAEAVGTVAEVQDTADAVVEVLGSVDPGLLVLEGGTLVDAEHTVVRRVDPRA